MIGRNRYGGLSAEKDTLAPPSPPIPILHFKLLFLLLPSSLSHYSPQDYSTPFRKHPIPTFPRFYCYPYPFLFLSTRKPLPLKRGSSPSMPSCEEVAQTPALPPGPPPLLSRPLPLLFWTLSICGVAAVRGEFPRLIRATTKGPIEAAERLVSGMSGRIIAAATGIGFPDERVAVPPREEAKIPPR